METVVIE